MFKIFRRTLFITIISMFFHVCFFSFPAKVSAEYRDKGEGYFRYAQEESEENEYWSKFPIPRLSKEFTKKQREVLWEALAKAQERIQIQEILDCIDKNTTYGNRRDETPSQAAQRFTITTQRMKVVDGRTRISLHERRQRLYISVTRDKNTDGWAYIGFVRGAEGDINIQLNYDNILGKGNIASDYWAGTIVHEIMHTFSYDHPKYNENKDYYNQFKGNFVYETGWCISGNKYN
jgi:hypothetical protein